MAHVQIATEQHSFIYEDGSVHTFDYFILQEGAVLEALPLGLVGDVSYILGKKGDAPHKFIKPTQLQFRIRDKNKELLNRLRGSRDKDFRFRIEENGAEIFDGYVNLQSKSWTYYQQIPVVELIGYCGLGTLQNTRFDAVASGVMTFKAYLDALLGLTGFTRNHHIYVRRDHEGVSASAYWPDQYRHNVDHILRDKQDRERFAWDALVEFCTRFGLQCFYWQGRWIFMDREQRVRFPQQQRRYSSIGDPFTNVNQLISAGRSTTIRFPQGEETPGIGRLILDWNIAEAAIEGLENNSFITDLSPWVITGTATHDPQDRASIPIEITDANSIQQTAADVLQPGDIITFKLDGSVRQDAVSEATDFDIDVLEVKILSLDSATELWLQGDGSWAATAFIFSETNIVFNGTPDPPDSHPYFIAVESDPIPSDPVDQRFNLSVEVHAAATVNTGADPNGLEYFNNVSHVFDTYHAPRTDLFTKRFLVTGPNPAAGDLELHISLSDEDTSTVSFSMEYDSDGAGTFLNTTDWMTAAGATQLAYLIALSMAAQQNGILETPTIRSRFPVGFTPLSTIEFDTEDYLLRCIPNYYKRLLHSGFVDIQAQQARFDMAGLTIEVLYLDEDGNPTDGPVDTHAPAAPTGLEVLFFSNGGVTLNWDDNAETDIAFYYVYVAGEADPVYSTLNTTSFASFGHDTSAQVCFVVTAVNEVGVESPDSAQVCGDPPSEAGVLVEVQEGSWNFDKSTEGLPTDSRTLVNETGSGNPIIDFAELYSQIFVVQVLWDAEWKRTGPATFEFVEWLARLQTDLEGGPLTTVFSHTFRLNAPEENTLYNDTQLVQIAHTIDKATINQALIHGEYTDGSVADDYNINFAFTWDFLALKISVTPGDKQLTVNLVTLHVLDADIVIYLDGNRHAIVAEADFPFVISGLTNNQQYTITATYKKSGAESGHTTPITATPMLMPVANQFIWYDANQETGFVDDQEMDQITDWSGNDRHALATGGAGNKPRWRAAGAGTNNLPEIEHSGWPADVTFSALSQPITICVMFRQSDAFSGSVFGAVDANAEFRLLGSTNFSMRAPTNLDSLQDVDNLDHAHICVFNTTGPEPENQNSEYHIDDVLKASADAGTNTLTGLSLTDDGSNFIGRVAEFILYDRLLNAAEIQEMFDYFNEKYGLAYGE